MQERSYPSVTSVIAERVRRGSKVEKRDDPFKVGLVIEGGGMKGVISGGMAIALQALNTRDAFDGVYANSSGSCAAAYFITNQTPEGTSIYYQNINNWMFFHPFRFIQGRPVVDIPFLTHEVMVHQKPLDAEQVVHSPIPLHTLVVSAKEVTTVDFDHYYSGDHVRDVLHYTCRMPVVAGMPIEVDGRYFCDGGTLIGTIALDRAVEDQCTHILVLLTRNKGTMHRERRVLELLIPLFLLRDFPELAWRYFDGHRNFHSVMKRINASLKNQTMPFISSIQPARTYPHISTLEMKEQALFAGAEYGYKLVLQAFQSEQLPINHTVYVKKC